MITNLIERNEFVVLIEEADEKEQTIEKCYFKDKTIGIAFYGSGSVEFKVSAGNEKEILSNTKGLAVSFGGNNQVEIEQTVSPIILEDGNMSPRNLILSNACNPFYASCWIKSENSD